MRSYCKLATVTAEWSMRRIDWKKINLNFSKIQIEVFNQRNARKAASKQDRLDQTVWFGHTVEPPLAIVGNRRNKAKHLPTLATAQRVKWRNFIGVSRRVFVGRTTCPVYQHESAA